MARVANSSPQTLLVLSLLCADPLTWHYGYDLSRRTGLRSGTLYPILARLHELGWLETRWTPADRPGRPPRHTYRLTDSGASAAAELVAQVDAKRPALRLGQVPAQP